MIYQSINQAVLDRIPRSVRSVLDVGCGGGVFGAAVKAAANCKACHDVHREKK